MSWLAAVAIVVGPLPALGSDPYASDPLGLIAYTEQVRSYATGSDYWEVFICDVPDGSVQVDLAGAVSLFNQEVSPYFSWMAEGIYTPAFRPGMRLSASVDSGWPDDPFRRQYECEQKARDASSGTATGAIVIVDVAYGGGYGSSGQYCQQVIQCPRLFPDNGRIVVVGAAAAVAVSPFNRPRLLTVAHEIGHALSLPHSYGGLTTHSLGFIWEYDNPMDLMSGGELMDLTVGTHALNKYAAGWISPQAAWFHRGGTSTYELSPRGASRFLVLPTDSPGFFEVLGPRTRAEFDLGIPAEGIEVYRIDQRGPACGSTVDSICWGVERRTAQVPAEDAAESTAHVFGVGAVFTVRGVSVEVLSRIGDTFTVRVSGATVSERFVDDNGNIHEPDIIAIADAGITLGCNPPLNDHYCPVRGVTRAEMAAFLLRAIGEAVDHSATVFSDVPADAWYAPYVAKLYELGITTGYADGTYRPGGTVTRAEMAVFLTRAFASLEPASSPTGIFSDVPGDVWYAAAVEGLWDAQVTMGCSGDPLSYCPDDEVRRDQMAAFLNRAMRG